MTDYYLKDLKYDNSNTKLIDTEYIDILDNQVRLYYNPHEIYEHREKPSGFNFYAVEFVGCDGLSDYKNDFDNPTVTVECLYHGIVYFDGLRHLYMGHEDTDNEGYLYYQNLENHILIFNAIEKLIGVYCDPSDL